MDEGIEKIADVVVSLDHIIKEAMKHLSAKSSMTEVFAASDALIQTRHRLEGIAEALFCLGLAERFQELFVVEQGRFKSVLNFPCAQFWQFHFVVDAGGELRLTTLVERESLATK